MRTIIIPSPAKINLHLQLQDKRQDGFHNLISVFHLVSLSDTIEIKETGENNNSSLSLRGEFSVSQKDNIITKTVNLFREATNYTGDLNIFVKKVIPEGGGLGGGSSNAAFTLLGLERLTGYSLSDQKAEEICLELGSDVLFFRKSTAALVTGRGEIINEIPPLPPMKLLIVKPPIKVATAEAFSVYSKMIAKEGIQEAVSKEKILSSLKNRPENWPFFNDFSDLLKDSYPVLAQVEYLLYSSGSIFASLTGSGSAVFGIFNDLKSFQQAEKVIKKDFSFCYKALLLDKNPISEL